MSKPKIAAGDIRAALRLRHPSKEWALFFEVSDAAGLGRGRSADAVAMNLWPSRGLEIHGFEIKVSRADWKRELALPEKAESVQRFCDRWWIAAPAGLIQASELPPTWGLLEIDASGKSSVAVNAPKLEALPITKAFIACVLRRASEADAGEVRSIVEGHVATRMKEMDAIVAQRVQRETERLSVATKRLEQIKAECGIDLMNFTPPKEMAAALRAVVSGSLFASYRALWRAHSATEDLQKHLSELIEAIGGMKAIGGVPE